MENITLGKKERIDVADVLRGIAVMGIILLHSIEHFNFYSYPETSSAFLKFTDKAIWDSLFFLFGGKAYGIFALLFGFSFFIQDNKQQTLGNDFRLRFAWRLLLLFIIGNINASFFTGEILVLYSIVGFTLIPVCRLSNKTVLIIATILMLQPMEWGKIIYALMHPDYIQPASLWTTYWETTFSVQGNGTFWETVKVNLWEGQLFSLTWAWENGRFFQTSALFMLGMVMGRTRFFLNTEKNTKMLFKTLMISLALFFPLYGLSNMIPGFIENNAISTPLLLIIKSWSNFSFMMFLVSSIILLYYHTHLKKLLFKITPYGKMSLTNYITQSIAGSLIFYGWGFAMHNQLGITSSFLVGIVLFVIQYRFACWWMSHHKQGFMEYLWKKATWIKF